jgi:hypothetical protein
VIDLVYFLCYWKEKDFYFLTRELKGGYELLKRTLVFEVCFPFRSILLFDFIL